MLLQQTINDTDTSYETHKRILSQAEQVGLKEQPSLSLHIGVHQDPGIRRRYKPNEDTVFVTYGVMPSVPSVPSISRTTTPTPFALCAVADGMGGQGHGLEASQLAMRCLSEYVMKSLCSEWRQPEDILPLLRAGVQFANQSVYERNQQQWTVMGTTMTVVLVINTVAYVAHVGDSRLYLYQQATGLTQLTRDHSAVAVLVEKGLIAPEDIYTHPLRNRIYRSLGDQPALEVDAFSMPLFDGDSLLMCSDGLWEMVRDPQLAKIMATGMSSPTNIAHTLIQAALIGGGDDNVSAIVAHVSKV